MSDEFEAEWRDFDKALKRMRRWSPADYYGSGDDISEALGHAIEALESLACIVYETVAKLEGLKIVGWKYIGHMLGVSERHVQRPEWKGPLTKSGVVKYEKRSPVAFALDLVLFKNEKKRKKGNKK